MLTKMLFSTTTIIPVALCSFRTFRIEFRQTAAQIFSHVRFARVAVRWLPLATWAASTLSDFVVPCFLEKPSFLRNRSESLSTLGFENLSFATSRIF
jgi:hypothetical protein